MSSEFYYVYRRTAPESIPAYLKGQDGSLLPLWTTNILEAEHISPSRVLEFVEDTSKLRRENPGKLLFMQGEGTVPEGKKTSAAASHEAITNLQECLTTARTDIKALQATLAVERDRLAASLELAHHINDVWNSHVAQAANVTAELVRQVKK